MKKTRFAAKLTAWVMLVPLVVVMLAGCSKTAVTTSDFTTLAQEKGFEIVDVADQFKSFDYVKQATIALNDNYQIEFYELTDSSYAASFYEGNKSKFELAKEGGNYVDSSVNGKNYAKYALTVGDSYKLIEYVENTAVYVDANKSYQSEIDAFLKELKY